MLDSAHALSVTLHLTQSCNMRCSYCFAHGTRGEMEDQTAERAVDFALAEARRSGQRRLEISFFGGEPLLQLALLLRTCDRFLARRSELDVQFLAVTNGLLLSDEALRELAARRVFVTLSLDGDSCAHDASRSDTAGLPTSARVEAAAKRLLRVNPCAGVVCVITPRTADRVDASVRRLAELGFGYVTTTLDYGGRWQREDLQRLRQGYERLSEWYVERSERKQGVYVSAFDERILTRTRGPLQPVERCGAAAHQFSIATSGRLYPCVQFVKEDSLPKGGPHCLGDIFSGFEIKRRQDVASRAMARKPECLGCALEDRCANWCACVSYQATGRLDAAAPLVCEHERMLIPIADRAGNKLWKRRPEEFKHRYCDPAFPAIDFLERMELLESPDG